MELKIFTFNLRVDSEKDGINQFPHRKLRILDTIKKYDPDIIGFQEVKDNMREWLCAALENYNVVGTGRHEDYLGEATVVAFKKREFMMCDMCTKWLSPTPDVPASTYGGDQSKCVRIYTAVTLKHRDLDKPFRFINTHLDHIGPNARLLEAKQLVGVIGEHPEMKFVLTGDFNALPGTPETEIFKTVGKDATENLGGTFHNFGKRVGDEKIKIDYIYTNAAISESFIIQDAPVNGVYISDHNPVCAVLEF